MYFALFKKQHSRSPAFGLNTKNSSHADKISSQSVNFLLATRLKFIQLVCQKNLACMGSEATPLLSIILISDSFYLVITSGGELLNKK